MIDKHILKLRARDDIGAEEETAIRGAVKDVVRLPADSVVVRAFEPMDYSTILVSGLACRQKDLRDGRRQITELHVAGDFTDLHSFTLKYLEHDIATLSDCRFAIVPHDRLREITERFPHLARVYWFATNLDAAIHREWSVSLGRRSALARMAHLFCELYVRLDLVDLTHDGGYDLPLTQAELADTLGMTAVHANRTLQELRSLAHVEFARGRVSISDFGLGTIMPRSGSPPRRRRW